jgi:Fe-S cluster assembly protein SufD
MNTTDKNLEKYLKAFEIHYNGESKQAFHKIRKNAIEKAGLLGFPSTKQEEWRFTNPAQIAKSDFKIADKSALGTVSAEDIAPFLIKDWDGSLIVFIDGYFSEKLSEIKDNPGVNISTLSKDFDKNESSFSKVSSIAQFEEDVFIALNTAFTSDGSLIKIAPNTVLKDKIHILHLASTADALSTNRNMIVLAENAQATVIESFHSLNEKGGFVNTVTEILVDENAHLNHYKFQDESVNHFHVGTTAIVQKANSTFTSLAFDFGGRLVRNNISTTLDGEGITSTLNGLYVGEGRQHIDNHTFIDHAMPHCESHELYRGILKDTAKGVFSGKIMVRKDAQKTDAKQSNNCLLLSDDAQIDAKPQLEIYADDVKCTHGATIGQLDDEAIEYLRSRGIPRKKAIEMLTYAFAEEIIISIDDAAFRSKLESRLLESLSK